jgi:hypothetical protein
MATTTKTETSDANISKMKMKRTEKVSCLTSVRVEEEDSAKIMKISGQKSLLFVDKSGNYRPSQG